MTIIWWIFFRKSNPNNVTTGPIQPTTPVINSASPTLPGQTPADAKIIPTENLCPQISQEYVTEVTGIAIERVNSLNGPQINACDYYLADDKNKAKEKDLQDVPQKAIYIQSGMNRLKTMPLALIWLPIHSMVVVTSPIGDQAPPALAAITTMPT